MKIKKLWGNFSIVSVLSGTILLGAFGSQSANAQFVDCVDAGNGSAWHNRNRDVSIGRELYRAVSYMYAYSEGDSVATCRVNPTPGSTYSYAVGYSDSDRNASPAELIIYRDGTEVSRQTIRSGQLYSRMIDTSNARSISIEAVCTRSSGCGTLWFTQLGTDSPRNPGRR
ncbi:hypothetical protein IQ273_23170 [Nodosilinea sp. LEGE 07298]|uniref:hypothetical protein n=1 Tax=Nodosilinea sp. LEGE 07298 TaxID=2777970 RepID=UPI0018817ED2|nr:hypothetical protein [Nodosilinea sp. LEGE 07298]MBE9112304.1 hypothetical protein [Nodosilinea sp. LEGE 07298]